MNAHWTMTLILIVALAGCTATRSVRTIGKGNTGIEASLGGPVFTNLGAPIPAPNLFIGGRYGIRDDLDLSLHYNLTGPFVPGIGLNVILSEHWVPIQPGIGAQAATDDTGWSLATAGSVHLITDFVHGALAVPVFEVAAGWRYKWINPYLGVSLAVQLYRPYEAVHPIMLNPFVGADIIVKDQINLALRVTVYDTTYSMDRSQIDWVYLVENDAGSKRYGMVGLSLGFSYDFLKSTDRPKKKHNLGTGGAK